MGEAERGYCGWEISVTFWEGGDEVAYFGIFAGLMYLGISDGGGIDAEENVFFDRA